MANQQAAAAKLLSSPIQLGKALGYNDFKQGLHDVWFREIVFGTNDYTLQAHRGSFKTTTLCVGIALLMLKYPSKNIIFLRKTDSDIAEVIKNVSRILQSDVMGAIFYALTSQRLTIQKATNSEITLAHYTAPRGASQLLGIGIGGSLTGKHADIVITDDIINRLDRVSQAERERTKSVYMELQNIRNRGGRIINTGTPWHKEDAFTLMPQPVKYDCYQTGLIDADTLETLKRSMSPSLFAANYELVHIAAENALFPTYPQTTDDSTVLRDGIAHIDAAYGGEDYTAFTCARRQGDTIYLYGRLFRAHVDTVLDSILADADRLMCSPIYCETNGDKSYLSKEIRRHGGETRPYAERMNKYLKISTYLRKWWGNIVLVDGTDKEYISQIMDYTEAAQHDDAPDSASVVCKILDNKESDWILE